MTKGAGQWSYLEAPCRLALNVGGLQPKVVAGVPPEPVANVLGVGPRVDGEEPVAADLVVHVQGEVVVAHTFGPHLRVEACSKLLME